MAQAKVLVDTNAYLRLAQSIHPLLSVEFGVTRYCLYVLPELEKELSRSPRLQTKFAWALDQEFRDNRDRYLQISRKQKVAIQNSFSYIWAYVQASCPGPSRIDVLHLAYGYELQVPVVTDDGDLRSAGVALGLTTWSSLDLLKVMVDEAHITIGKVNELVQFWRYWQDSPTGLVDDYKRLFGTDPP